MLPSAYADGSFGHHEANTVQGSLPQPEPDCGPRAVGCGHEVTQSAFPRFVIQEHHARRLHWDFRLERDGVLRSWAVPKGLPMEAGVRRLAIEVDDHPLSYIDFAGVIPPGNYGAGTVSIWDHGHYAVAEWKDDKIVVVLLGERVQGGYHMVRTNEQHWLLFRGKEI